MRSAVCIGRGLPCVHLLFLVRVLLDVQACARAASAMTRYCTKGPGGSYNSLKLSPARISVTACGEIRALPGAAIEGEVTRTRSEAPRARAARRAVHSADLARLFSMDIDDFIAPCAKGLRRVRSREVPHRQAA